MKKILIVGFFILIMTMSFLLVACTNNDDKDNLKGEAAGMFENTEGGRDCVSLTNNCGACKRCCGQEHGTSRCSSSCQMAYSESCE